MYDLLGSLHLCCQVFDHLTARLEDLLLVSLSSQIFPVLLEVIQSYQKYCSATESGVLGSLIPAFYFPRLVI